MTDTALEQLFDAAGLERGLAQRWSEKAKAEGQTIDRALVDSGVLDPISARTFRTIVKGYATIDPSSIAERVDLNQARLLVPPPPSPEKTEPEGEVISLDSRDEAASTLEADAPADLARPANQRLPKLPPVPPRNERSRHIRVGPVPLGFGDPESWLGSTLGPYILRRFLGEGSTARVFEVEHAVLQVSRILKLPARGADSSTILAEARLLERLAHPGVAPFLEFDVDKGCPFAVFRYQEGRCLSDELNDNGRLTETQLIQLGCDISAVLAFCHARDILHLDLKPANLFLTDAGAVVLDFGIAAVREDLARYTHFYGTPQFAAPEQVVAPESIDTKADLYGLGMTLYASAVGQLESEVGGESMFSHLFGELRPLSELRPELSAGLLALIDNLLQRSPQDRPESAGAVQSRLLELNTPKASKEIV